MRVTSKDLTGQRFGRWTVIERCGSKNRRAVWKCRCDCGNIGYITTYDLKGGKSKSCGCLLKDINRDRAIHGDSKSYGEYNRLYKIWSDMKNRCGDSHNHAYSRYGGIGVKVCEAWSDYTAFKEWALNNGYDNKLTIDRIDAYGDYTPENCRWADYYTQARNKRATKRYEYNGEAHSVVEWSEITGINASTLWNRLHSNKWSIAEALTTPTNCRHKHISTNMLDTSDITSDIPDVTSTTEEAIAGGTDAQMQEDGGTKRV